MHLFLSRNVHQQQTDDNRQFAHLVGNSEPICTIRQAIEKIAESAASALVRRLSGSGKAIAARMQPSRRTAVCRYQLRRNRRRPARKQNVWLVIPIGTQRSYQLRNRQRLEGCPRLQAPIVSLVAKNPSKSRR
jgi:hypothetical protein